MFTEVPFFEQCTKFEQVKYLLSSLYACHKASKITTSCKRVVKVFVFILK